MSTCDYCGVPTSVIGDIAMVDGRSHSLEDCRRNMRSMLAALHADLEDVHNDAIEKAANECLRVRRENDEEGNSATRGSERTLLHQRGVGAGQCYEAVSALRGIKP